METLLPLTGVLAISSLPAAPLTLVLTLFAKWGQKENKKPTGLLMDSLAFFLRTITEGNESQTEKKAFKIPFKHLLCNFYDCNPVSQQPTHERFSFHSLRVKLTLKQVWLERKEVR